MKLRMENVLKNVLRNNLILMVYAQIVMRIAILVLIKVLNVHHVELPIIYFIKTNVFLNVQQVYFKLDFLVLHVHHLVKHVILVQLCV